MDSTHLPAVPGLLLECSPVRFGGEDGPNGIVAETPGPNADLVSVTFDDHTSFCHLEHLELRLDVATGRAHAAWWARARVEHPLLGNASMEALELACAGKHMNDGQIGTLRDMVRRLWLDEEGS